MTLRHCYILHINLLKYPQMRAEIIQVLYVTISHWNIFNARSFLRRATKVELSVQMG